MNGDPSQIGHAVPWKVSPVRAGVSYLSITIRKKRLARSVSGSRQTKRKMSVIPHLAHACMLLTSQEDICLES